MSTGEAGSNPYDSMSEASKAEAMVESIVYLGVDFEGVVEELNSSVSIYVKPGLGDFSERMMENLSLVVESGISLAQNVEGANLAILDTDHESAEQVSEGLSALDIPINF